MRRTVILATLTFLLLAVGGVTAAQEGAFYADPQGSGQDRPAAQELSIPGAAQYTGPEEPGFTLPTGGYGGPAEPGRSDGDSAGGRNKRPAAQEAESAGKNQEDAGNLRADKPEAEKPKKVGEPGDAGKPEEMGGGGQRKVILCHKGKTVTVGAPARAAHVGHGDDLGACQ